MAKGGSCSTGAVNHAMAVQSGVMIEEKNIDWNIENFSIVFRSLEYLKQQEFILEIGSSVQFPVKVLISLRKFSEEQSNKKEQHWIGVFFELVEFTEDKEVNVQRTVKVKAPGDEEYYFEGFDAFFNLAKKPIVGWGFGRIIKMDLDEQDLPLINGALKIKINFKLFAVAPPNINRVPDFMVQEFQRNSVNFFNQQTEWLGECCKSAAPIKLVSNDNQIFTVCRAVLLARNVAFTNLSQFDKDVYVDLSGKTLKVLLHYIKTGLLLDSWKDMEVLLELPEAAQKYQLEMLTQFLDDILVSVCTTGIGNLNELLLVAGRAGLKKAEKELHEILMLNVNTLGDRLSSCL